jgi:hypothetical protein
MEDDTALRKTVFALSLIVYYAFSIAVSNLPASPSVATWKTLVLASSVPMALLVLFLFSEPISLWSDVSRPEGRFVRTKLIILLGLPPIVLARLSEWLQLEQLGYSIKLVYSMIGTIGLQYVYFPILSIVSFAFTVLLFCSFPVESPAKKLLFVRINFRTLYEFLETTMYFLFCLTAMSDISQWLGFEPAPASPNVIPFTPTMWMEYLTLNLVGLPAYWLVYLFLYRESFFNLSFQGLLLGSLRRITSSIHHEPGHKVCPLTNLDIRYSLRLLGHRNSSQHRNPQAIMGRTLAQLDSFAASSFKPCIERPYANP